MATPLFNIFGAAALLLGALWGASQFWTSGRPDRAVANLLIAAGALVPSFASGLTRFGFTASLAAGQLIGLWLILAGFLLALRASPAGGPQVRRSCRQGPFPEVEAALSAESKAGKRP